MKKIKNNFVSTCLLTGDVGKMVKSHIIPKALTRNEKKGDFFIEERNINGRIVYSKVFDSWYDSNITFFRLYHDGLIIRFMDREITNTLEIESNPSIFVDNHKSTFFIKIQFKDSKQEKELLEVRKRYESK